MSIASTTAARLLGPIAGSSIGSCADPAERASCTDMFCMCLRRAGAAHAGARANSVSRREVQCIEGTGGRFQTGRFTGSS
eukprot:scaffold66583_cov64-Phaeocystis_antarctica.AAC.2